MDALSLQPRDQEQQQQQQYHHSPQQQQHQHQHRPRRPSLLHSEQHHYHHPPDKHHSYFADAKVNTQQNTSYDYDDLGAEDGDGIDGDMMVVTPSLAATQGAELEAAIHLAAIATGGRNGGDRLHGGSNNGGGGYERIYVTTSSNPHSEPIERHHQNRSLRPMGSYSDQSSYGTAPSLTTEASTHAESSSGGGLGGLNYRSPPDSTGLSTDETSEVSPPLSLAVNSLDPHQDADSNSGSNGTGKYVSH